MGKFNEIKNAIVEKCGKAKSAVAQYFTEKKEAKDIREMRQLLHFYFDLKGLDMSQAEIQKVNDYLLKTVVISQSSELGNLKKHVYQLSNINGGVEALKKDRAQVRAKLRDGKIISKTDALMGADTIIYNDRGIKTIHYVDRNGVFEKEETTVRPFNVFALSINPDALHPIDIKAYNKEMQKHIDKFQDVRAVAFPEHTNYSIK